jgi:7,8-dihydropterin-6-yl-methyl-4-(beta-D-ribofuranosyl)aminobenzene 5'-phosphate synthase
MKARLTVLCENSAGFQLGLVGEHGFACLVETGGGDYLFDTGQGFGIVSNALSLKKDLGGIAAVMLSHGHADHTGGLPAVLKVRGPVDVYGHRDLFLERISSRQGQKRFIGIPYNRHYLEFLGARFQLGDEIREVGPGVFLTGEIPRRTAFEKGDTEMTALLPDGQTLHPDPIRDDLSLIVDTDKGLVVVLGCAHAGLINIIDYTLETMGRDRIYAILGGTHLGFTGDAQFEATLAAIDRYRIERIGVSHCTGPARAAMLYARYPHKFFFGSVGAVLEA